MLEKDYRITKKKDFEVVFKKGKTIKRGLLICKVLRGSFKKSRFGFVVSKKVSQKATIRNKIRRRLQVAVKEEFLRIKSSVDMVIIAEPGIDKLNFNQIKDLIILCLDF
jgi:ribonuclease P protein component